MKVQIFDYNILVTCDECVTYGDAATCSSHVNLRVAPKSLTLSHHRNPFIQPTTKSIKLKYLQNIPAASRPDGETFLLRIYPKVIERFRFCSVQSGKFFLCRYKEEK